MNKKLFSVFLGFVVMLLTLLRENIFLEINGVLNKTGYNKAYFYLLQPFIEKLPSNQLIVLKWVLTILFIVIISFLTVMIIKWWFNQPIYTKTTIKILMVFFGFCITIALFFWFFGFFNQYYFVLRKLVGLFTSPLPLFLFFVMYLYLSLLRLND